MTQATVNAVKNLNPNAQHFSSSDFNNGTVLTGATIPSDDSYTDYIEHNAGPFVRQHPTHLYTDIDPSAFYDESSSMGTLQGSDSTYPVNEHQGTMLDPRQRTNHFPTAPAYAPMPEDEQIQMAELSPEEKRARIRKQLTYYFSEQNIVNDKFLMSNMDQDDYVSIAVIANFNILRRLTDDLQLITDILKELPFVEVDPDEKLVRSTIIKKNRLTGKRCIIILRDVPSKATENEISDLFANEQCPVRAVSCERVLDSGDSGCWYVTFNSEDDAHNAFVYLTRENVSIRGQKVLARMKARLRQIPTSVPSTNVSTPVSPPMPVNANNGGATSPPPNSQQPLQSYPTANFPSQQQQQPQVQPQQPPQQQQQQQQQQPPTSQQQQQQQQTQAQAAPLSMPQYSSQLHQSPYNPSPVHSPLYMQAAANQSSILGNLQTSSTPYRHPMHSSMGPAHLPAQYSSNNQAQHPTSMDHTSSLPHIRMAYPNYANIQFDRTPWGSTGAPHQSSVQNSQAALSYASANPQASMSSYHPSLAHHAQFLAANPNLFPGSFVYMSAPPYSTNEPYQTMPYNGPNKQKMRTSRDHPSSSRPRNSTRSFGARNSRQEGLQMANEHPNDLLDYGAHSTPHSEGSSSPVPRTEITLNRPNDSLASGVANLSLQHVSTYPSNSLDTSASDQEHYQSHPANDILYTNKTNSHQIQGQPSSDSNPSQEQSNESQPVGKYPAQSSYPTATSMNNVKASPMNYQPLEQRTSHLSNNEQSNPNANDDDQQQMNKKGTRPSTNPEQNATSIPPLMSRDGRANANANRPSSSQQTGRPQQQQAAQGRPNSTTNHPNSSTPLSLTIPKHASVTYYNQTSSPQSPNTNQKTQSTAAAAQPSTSSQQIVNDNNGPRSYADMLKLKQAPQKATDPNKSTVSPPNESNDFSSSRAQSPAINAKLDSVSTSGIASSETNGPTSSSSSDLSPSNPPDSLNAPSSASTTNDSNLARRSSSASDHPQQSSTPSQQQQQHSSPSHQQYNNSRGRGGRGGNYRYSNDRRSAPNNNINRGGGRGVGRRSMNNNNPGSNGPPPYQSRGNARGNGRFFDRPRGAGGNYHNSNQTVHRLTGNAGNVEPQAHYTE